jgi:hypothetical protein
MVNLGEGRLIGELGSCEINVFEQVECTEGLTPKASTRGATMSSSADVDRKCRRVSDLHYFRTERSAGESLLAPSRAS